jgi:Uma2 family endonuclease
MTPEEITERTLSEYEIERGKPMPSLNHGIIQSNLCFAILTKYRKEYSVISELSVELEKGKVVVPDLCIYPKKVYNGFKDRRKIAEPPLTAIEILSPTQGTDEFGEKFEGYFAAGVKSCWFVQPMVDTIFVITPDKNISPFHKGVLTDPATGITLDLNDVFA